MSFGSNETGSASAKPSPSSIHKLRSERCGGRSLGAVHEKKKKGTSIFNGYGSRPRPPRVKGRPADGADTMLL